MFIFVPFTIHKVIPIWPHCTGEIHQAKQLQCLLAVLSVFAVFSVFAVLVVLSLGGRPSVTLLSILFRAVRRAGESAEAAFDAAAA